MDALRVMSVVERRVSSTQRGRRGMGIAFLFCGSAAALVAYVLRRLRAARRSLSEEPAAEVEARTAGGRRRGARSVPDAAPAAPVHRALLVGAAGREEAAQGAPRRRTRRRRGLGARAFLGGFRESPFAATNAVLRLTRPRAPRRASASQVQWADALVRPVLRLEVAAGSQAGASFTAPPHLTEVRRPAARPALHPSRAAAGRRPAWSSADAPPPQVSVGRVAACDFVIADPEVSSLHARFSWDAGGHAWTLWDPGSLNGTRLNGVLVSRPNRTRGAPHPLAAGDLVQLGERDESHALVVRLLNPADGSHVVSPPPHHSHPALQQPPSSAPSSAGSGVERPRTPEAVGGAPNFAYASLLHRSHAPHATPPQHAPPGPESSPAPPTVAAPLLPPLSPHALGSPLLLPFPGAPPPAPEPYSAAKPPPPGSLRLPHGLAEGAASGRPSEDRCLVECPLRGHPHFGLFCVFDGHCGAGAAERAALALPAEVSRALAAAPRGAASSPTGFGPQLRAAFLATDAAIRCEYEGCAATAVLVWRAPGGGLRLQAANVGDAVAAAGLPSAPQPPPQQQQQLAGSSTPPAASSPLPQPPLPSSPLAPLRCVALSEEHKVRSPGERARLAAAGVALRPGDTRLYGLALARALGDRFLKEDAASGLTAEPYVSPPIDVAPPQGGDGWGASQPPAHCAAPFFVVASDGLWDVVSPAAAVAAAATAGAGWGGSHGAAAAAGGLLASARARRSKDDATVLVVALRAEEAA